MVNRYLFNILIWVIPSVIFLSCQNKSEKSQVQVKWESSDPMTIPYWIRQQKYEKENLVRNNSFENGKEIYTDSISSTFRIEGWEKIGENVQWVNIQEDKSFKNDEVFDSTKSVKIHRTICNETDDPGEGIMSEFIRVIPGNFQLTYYIRLENIESCMKRFGLSLFDAVNIRVYYYDKNKIKINSEKFDPVLNSKIDHSFKSLSFSGFWEIPQLNWTRIIGKSSNSTFFDGDIPDEARYVKLFFGLKGTGTMWIDKVDFRYTNLNFSSLEKMQKLLDTNLLIQETLIPYPKFIRKFESVTYYDPKSNISKPPVIIIPYNASSETKEAAYLLKEKIESIISKLNPEKDAKIVIGTEIANNITSTSGIIFSIGKNNLYKRFSEILPVNSIEDNSQSYFIHTQGDISNIIFLCGNNPLGDYYAAATAIQLFDSKAYIFHNTLIIDYPDVNQRIINLGVPDNIVDAEDLKIHLKKFKLNGLATSYQLSELSVKTLSRFNDQNSLVIPYGIFLSNLQPLAANNREDMTNSQLSGFVTKIDNRSVSFLSNQDLRNLNLSIEFTKNLRSYLTVNGKENNMILILPWTDNESMNYSAGYSENILKDLNIEDFDYLWCGSSAFSNHTDNCDISKVVNIMENKPVFWDNSEFSYTNLINNSQNPVKQHLYNIFEPFYNTDIRYLINSVNKEKIFINQTYSNELDAIKIATAADFLWNIYTYNPEISLWRALHLRYGKECARELVYLNNEYVNLVQITNELKNPYSNKRESRKGEIRKTTLLMKFNLIVEILGNDHPLVVILKTKINEVVKEFDAIQLAQNQQLN